jgi:PAS domain S-box-containing protein
MSEAELEQRVELLTRMLDSSPDELWLLTATGDVVAANQAAERSCGMAQDAMIGRPVGALGGTISFGPPLVAEVMATGATVSRITAVNGGRTRLVCAHPVAAADGRPSHVYLTVRDVTGANGQMPDPLIVPGRPAVRGPEMTMVQQPDGPRGPGVPAGSEAHGRVSEQAALHTVRAGAVVGASPSIQAARDLATRYAAVDAPVLLLGETGTGKTLFAKLIHSVSARQSGPFLEIACGAIPDTLVEAELFGYVRGAFTGADIRGRPGLVELAHGGTLFLDEIGELSVSTQVKLLRFLDTGTIWPLGAVKGKQPDVRIIAATNRDLLEGARQGTFRQDLFYRLNVLSIYLPALRDRREDIPPLIHLMLGDAEQRFGRQRRFSQAALDAMGRYSFPGNVRELRNVVDRLVLTVDKQVIDVGDLGLERGAIPPTGLRDALHDLEARMLRDALARCGTQSEAARHLGVSQTTVARKVKEHRLGALPAPSELAETKAGFGRPWRDTSLMPR